MTRRDLEAWQLLIGTTSELMKEMDVGNGRYQLSKSSAFIEGNFIDTVQREVLLTRFAHSEEERVAAILPLLAQYAQSPWSSQHHTPRRPRSSCSPSAAAPSKSAIASGSGGCSGFSRSCSSKRSCRSTRGWSARSATACTSSCGASESHERRSGKRRSTQCAWRCGGYPCRVASASLGRCARDGSSRVRG